MRNLRLIARLDIKGENLIKGIHLEGLRVMGDPHVFSRRYYEQGIDELIYMDVVASLYGRNNLDHIIKRAAQDVFVPITVGGGLRSVEDVKNILRSGADKVAINTAAVQRPALISDVAEKFGGQCVVLSVEAKKTGPGQWEAYTDNGRERTGLNVIDWIRQGVEMGAGEILLTSVDQEGTGRGFDIDLMLQATAVVDVPVIASGGMGSADDLIKLAAVADVDAVAMADILHYNKQDVSEIRTSARIAKLGVRQVTK